MLDKTQYWLSIKKDETLTILTMQNLTNKYINSLKPKIFSSPLFLSSNIFYIKEFAYRNVQE